MLKAQSNCDYNHVYINVIEYNYEYMAFLTNVTEYKYDSSKTFNNYTHRHDYDYRVQLLDLGPQSRFILR